MVVPIVHALRLYECVQKEQIRLNGVRAWLVCMCTGHLGKCLNGATPNTLDAALEAFQRERMRETRREVLFSRHLGRLKQGLDGERDWFTADEGAAKATAQANMAGFCPSENGH